MAKRQAVYNISLVEINSLDGIRHAVRPQSVGITHDADQCPDETKFDSLLAPFQVALSRGC